MVIKRLGDLVYTFRFIRLLTTKFEDSSAYKLGLIDKSGKRDRSIRIDTTDKKNAYTAFHRLVYNLKRIINKSGSEKFSSFASALYLIKEKYNIRTDLILDKCQFNRSDFINENSQWYILENGILAPGMYRLRSDKLLNETCDDIVFEKDQIKINDIPIGEILGIEIYEAVHQKTQKKIYVGIGEIYK